MIFLDLSRSTFYSKIRPFDAFEISIYPCCITPSQDYVQVRVSAVLVKELQEVSIRVVSESHVFENTMEYGAFAHLEQMLHFP